MKRVVLIDGKNLAYRVHFTHRGLSSHGFPTSVLYGALANLLSMSRRIPDTPFVWCWDGAGKTWRHKMAAATYKATREEMRQNHASDVALLHQQLPVLKKFLINTGFKVYEVPRLECDDLIGILTKEIIARDLFDEVIIYSGDKDFYQFIGERVKQVKGMRDGKLAWADPKEIKEEFGIPVSKWTQLRAIIGDPSDNIPRIFPGVGPKTAAKFVLAGIDASQEKPPKGVQLQYIIRKKEVDFKASWDKVRLNYILSQIPTEWHCQYYDSGTKRTLRSIVKALDRDAFLRDPEITDDEERYRDMVGWLMRYDMEELYTQRQVIWQLP